MNISSKNYLSSVGGILMALALASAAPVMAQQNAAIAPQATFAELAARRAISESPRDVFSGRTNRSAINDATTLVSNENRARCAIDNSGCDGTRPSTPVTPAAVGLVPTLSTNELAAQSVISQVSAPKTHESSEANGKRKIGLQPESISSATSLLVRQP